MIKLGSFSFRRLLLIRILLLSIPIILLGEYAAYEKMKSILISAAQQHLTESAIRQGNAVAQVTTASRALLATTALAIGETLPSPARSQTLVEALQQQLPQSLTCVQLVTPTVTELIASTCGDRPLLTATPAAADPARSAAAIPQPDIMLPSPANGASGVVLRVPIYNTAGTLQGYLQAQLQLGPTVAQRDNLSSETIIIAADGTVLAHPNPLRIGANIRDIVHPQPLPNVVQNAAKQPPGNLYFREQNQLMLAGHSTVNLPATDSAWLVLAAAPDASALASMRDIRQILLLLTLGLVGANLLVALYLSREVARPVEVLSHYARHVDQRQPQEEAPKNFRVKEFNQLAAALDSMVAQLEDRARELELAWQEAQVANQLKSDFLATTSHELRTPLNAIIGSIRLIRDDCCDGPEEVAEFLKQADDAALHLLKVINDLLDISKIEAGKVELHLQSVSVPHLCQQCLRMVEAGAAKKRLQLSLAMSPQINCVSMDERRVRQMLINLLSNAVKFTGEGGQVQVAAQIRPGRDLQQDQRPDESPVPPEANYLCLEVRDSGIGIPRDRWHLLFRPFQQVDSSRTRKHEGTGLGLVLTKRLAELHGGTVSFRSTPGEGSVFRIWLPSPDLHVCSPTQLTDDDVARKEIEDPEIESMVSPRL